MANINEEIFKRYKPENKLKIVENCSESDLLSVRVSTIIRCIKEAGRGEYGKQRSHNKGLYISGASNNWNAAVESLSLYKGKLGVSFYVQYSNTDGYEGDSWENFMKHEEYQGSISYTDRYGGTQTDYFRFDRSDKARVIKAILTAYIKNKSKHGTK